jgi:hypothetical protein
MKNDSSISECFRELRVQRRDCTLANKEQKKVQKAPPKSNKQKKERQKEKKAAKSSSSGIALKNQ